MRHSNGTRGSATVPMAYFFGEEDKTMRHVKVLVEKHAEGYIAYPVGLQGVVVGRGQTYEDALEDVTSSIRSYIETNGADSFDIVPQVVEIVIPDTGPRRRR